MVKIIPRSLTAPLIASLWPSPAPSTGAEQKSWLHVVELFISKIWNAICCRMQRWAHSDLGFPHTRHCKDHLSPRTSPLQVIDLLSQFVWVSFLLSNQFPFPACHGVETDQNWCRLQRTTMSVCGMLSRENASSVSDFQARF